MRRKPPELRARLTAEEKVYLMAAILRDPVIFSAAFTHLDPAIIDPVTDAAFLCLWRSAKNVAEKNNNNLPDEAQARLLITVEADKVALFDSSTISADNLRYLVDPGGLLDYIYNLPPNSISTEYAKRNLTAYLEERLVYEEVLSAAQSMNGPLIPANLQPFLDKIDQQRTAIQGLITPEVEVPFYRPNQIKVVKVRSTGCTFFDRFMNGGDADGEMYTLMAPTGCGKTLASVQLFMSGALREQIDHYQHPETTLGCWYYFNYEDQAGLGIRLWANAAEIEHPQLSSGEPLSTTGNLKPYEIKRFGHKLAQNEIVLGEQERLAEAEKLYNLHKNFYIHDFTGTNPGVGSGGVAEIQRVLDMDVRKGRRIAGVVIDYAGLVVERQIEAGLLRQEDRWASLNGFGQQVVNKICARFGAKAWVLHQLHGDTSRRSPTAKYHHSEAQGAHNFANAAWFPFQIGVKDANNIAHISCHKTRRAAGQVTAAAVRIDGAVCRMYDEDDRYTVSGSTFVLKTDAHKIVEVPTAQPQRQRRAMDADMDEFNYGS